MSESEQQGTSYSEPKYALPSRKNSEYPFYLPSIDKHLVPEMRKLLETYSGIPSDQQSEHVHKIRDQAMSIRAYPCTGLGVWLVPYISRSPAYAFVLTRLKTGGTFLDVGVFLGGDMRWLASDGAPTDKMYGVDIVSHWDVGYSLFHDRDRFRAHFIESDFLSIDNPELTALHGCMDVISISAVLHQWTLAKQVEAAKRLVTFSSKHGTIILGYQIGNIEAKEVPVPDFNASLWRHDPASFVRLWDQVGAETGTKWETKTRLLTWEDMGWDPNDYRWMEPGDRVLDFVVTRMK